MFWCRSACHRCGRQLGRPVRHRPDPARQAHGRHRAAYPARRLHHAAAAGHRYLCAHGHRSGPGHGAHSDLHVRPGATASSQPIVIQGTTGTGESDLTHPLRQEALVIDARGLPAGSVLDLNQVEFAIIIGSVRVIGGEGRNFAIGDGAAQWMVLGADDDAARRRRQ